MQGFSRVSHVFAEGADIYVPMVSDGSLCMRFSVGLTRSRYRNFSGHEGEISKIESPVPSPDRTLTSKTLSRVLMAHAQRLAEQVKVANARIKELECALSEAQLQTGREGSHPLLQLNNMNDTETSSLETIFDDGIPEISEAIGSLSIGSDGKAKYHGESAGSEVRTGLTIQDFRSRLTGTVLAKTYKCACEYIFMLISMNLRTALDSRRKT